MSIRTAPCDWTADYADCTSTSKLEDTGDYEMYEQAAVEYLWNWTGKRFGTCEVTVRPCRQDCFDERGMSTFFGYASGPFPNGVGAPWRPVIIDGLWYNLSCGVCRGECGCSRVHALRLPGPIDSITEVVIGGETLPAEAYRVDNNKSLVRLDGEAWPTCQNMNAAPGEEGTWTVTYKRGIAVPAGGQIAAGLLACELAKAACNDSTCQLPKRVQSITRQGVTIAMLDAFDDIDKGHTGIWAIDSWIASVTKAPTPSRVLSPDRRPRVSRTTWGG